MNEPLWIPKRTAYRLCADILFAKADHMRRKNRTGPRGPANPHKAANRDELAKKVVSFAAQLSGLATSSDCPGDVEPGCLAYLLAWLTGWDPGFTELVEELKHQGKTLVVPRVEVVEVCKFVIGD